MDEKDIWRTAALLIKQHGEKASEMAMLRVLNMTEQNDADGQAVWTRIAQAVSELTRTKGDGVVH
jgi:hypothetical protein